MWNAKRKGDGTDLLGVLSLLIGSDYGDRTERYSTYTFVVSDQGAFAQWREVRDRWRRALPDDRRMAYKKLRTDGVLRRGLAGFLEAADNLPLLVTVAVNNRIPSLADGGPFREEDFQPSLPAGMKASVLDRYFPIAHIVALLSAGLSDGHDDVLWISDQDDFTANNSWKNFHRNFANRTHSVLFNEGPHIRGFSTDDPEDKLLYEDFCSVADLATGSVSRYLAGLTGALHHGTRDVARILSVDPRSDELIEWFAGDVRRLRWEVWCIDEASVRALEVSNVKFLTGASNRRHAEPGTPAGVPAQA